MALLGWWRRLASGPATWPWETSSARGSTPRASARSRVVTMHAAAPSEICEALPAVMLPSATKAARSRAREAASTSDRMPSSSVSWMGSPRRWGMLTGTISSASRPSFWALAARSWDWAEKASCGSRARPISAA